MLDDERLNIMGEIEAFHMENVRFIHSKEQKSGLPMS